MRLDLNLEPTVLLRVEQLSKSFHNTQGQPLPVLENISFQIQAGDRIALVGQSGSGKSTLVRLMVGLTKPTQGSVFYKNQLLTQPIPEIAMVFQNFALLPWLDVLENVELGLEAEGMPAVERRARSLKILDMIGLDGFESAYPKELSGGMRQRVGIARALVVEPELLIMDEPFSALDIFTAENLRNDLIDLWGQGKMKTQAMLCVTHNIEEAVLLATKIFVFSSNPGQIQFTIPVNLAYPRNPKSAPFKRLVDQVYHFMMIAGKESAQQLKLAQLPAEIAYRLPKVNVSELTGLLESMEPLVNEQHCIEISKLGDELYLDINELFPLTEGLEILNFIKMITASSMIQITASGLEFLKADILARKLIFRKNLVANIPLASYIHQKLEQHPQHIESEEYFIGELSQYFSTEEAEKMLTIMIDWGRYAELYAYDYETGLLSLENPK